MCDEHLRDMLSAGLTALELDCDAPCQARLLAHLDALQRWRARLNLTALDQPREMLVKHTLDSLAIWQWVKGDQVLDMGTGAGFPGLSLASVRPGWQFTLLDSRGKRIEFIRYVLSQLHGESALTNVTLVHSRIEQYTPCVKFDTLIARAVASLIQLVELSAHLLKPGTRLVAMKGQSPEEEIDSLISRADFGVQAGFEVQSIPVAVPYLDDARHVVVIDRI